MPVVRREFEAKKKIEKLSRIKKKRSILAVNEQKNRLKWTIRERGGHMVGKTVGGGI